MTERKFKHKETGWIAEKMPFVKLYQLKNSHCKYEGELHSTMVENSNDWEEIKEAEPLILTKDGVRKYNQDKAFHVSEKGIDTLFVIPGLVEKLDGYWYDSYENAQQQAKYLKPKYSDQDLRDAYNDIYKRGSIIPKVDGVDTFIKKLMEKKR